MRPLIFQGSSFQALSKKTQTEHKGAAEREQTKCDQQNTINRTAKTDTTKNEKYNWVFPNKWAVPYSLKR